MAVATCQFTQGSTVGGSGKSVFGFSPGIEVTCTDDGGPGATSYLWELLSWPASLATPPVIVNETSQVATITPPLDGVYIFKLTRTEVTVVTSDYKFFGVADEDDLTLPSAGQSGYMTNQSPDAQRGGWAGRANASTNFQLDAYLRFLKSRVGRYVGHIQVVNHTGAQETFQVQDGASKPFRVVSVGSGSGLYTEQLVVPASEGKRFRYLVSLTSGAAGVQVLNGVGGSTLLDLSAPPIGVTTYEAELVSDGSQWSLARLSLVGDKTFQRVREFDMVAGLKTTDQTLPTRIGTCRISTNDFPTNTQFKFVAQIEVTVGRICSIQVYNLTDGEYLGTPLITNIETPTQVEQVLTLPSGTKDYEVLLWMTVPGGPADRVTCTSAKIVAKWG